MTRGRAILALAPADRAALTTVLARARRLGFHRFVGEPEPGPASETWYRATDEGYSSLGDPRRAGVRLRDAHDPATWAELRDARRSGESFAVRWQGDRIIPLENLLAEPSGGGELWVLASAASEAPGLVGALERGADAVVVPVRSERDVEELARFLEPSLPDALDWHAVPVRRVEPAGLGDRVIVDTTSLLDPSEGLLVGSASAFLFHVASEATGSAHTRPRAFRVNAGAPHSYVLLADGSSRYLSELAPGEAVLVARPRGALRSVRVGRLKIERRPLTLIEAEFAGRARTVFVQEAETVRLSGESDRIEVTRLTPGEKVLGVRAAPARHFGQAIEEQIEER